MKRALLCLLLLAVAPAQARPEPATGRLEVRNGSDYTAAIYLEDEETGETNRIGVIAPREKLTTREPYGRNCSLYALYFTPRVTVYKYGPVYTQGRVFRWKVPDPAY